MADIYSANIAPVQTDLFYFQWYSVMAQLKAGWLLKHSANGSSKASANPADPNNCLWATPAIVQNFSVAGAASIGPKYGKDFYISGLSGLVSPTNLNQGGSEGNLLYITGSSSAGNNVVWMITRVVDATSCYARPLVPTAVTSSGTSPPVMTISGHLARTRLFSLRVETVLIGALGTAQIKISLTGAAPFATTVTIPSNGVVEVIDVNGVATGIYLSFAGAISNLNNVWTASTAVANDANNGSIKWVERSWLTATYSSMANGAWIALEGPCTLKIPFTTAPTGTFIRGENIIQTGSNAEGELLGVTFEPSTGVGYLVVFPRLQGGGNGAEGWSTGIITGSRSSAYVTPSALPTRLVREMVWWRGSDLKSGTWYYQPVLDSTENFARFGLYAFQGGCTATVCPGGGGIGNTFPTIAYAVTGTGGTTSHNTQAWGGTNYSLANQIGRLQLFTANCIDKQNTSCDGSFISTIFQPQNSTQSTGNLPIFMKLTDTEEGDIEPYAAWHGMASGQTTRARTGNTSVIASGESWGLGAPWVGANYGWWSSWRKRGFATVTPSSGFNTITSNGLIVNYDTSNASSYPGSGNLVTDLQGNTNATLANSPTFSNGVLTFNGTNQALKTETSLASLFAGTSPNKSTVTSLFLWVFPVSAGNILVERGASTFTDSGWADSNIEISSGGVFSFSTWHNSLSNRVNSSAQSFNNWYYIGWTYDGATLTAYINGVSVGTTSFSRQAPYNNGFGLHYSIASQVGTNMGTNSYCNMSLGAFHVYNTALTASEVFRNYDVGRSRFNIPPAISTAEGDSQISLASTFPFSPGAGAYVNVFAGSGTGLLINQDRVASTAASEASLIFQPIYLASFTANARMRKGYLNYMFLTNGYFTYYTYKNRTWLQCNYVTDNSIAGLAAVIPRGGNIQTIY